MYFNRERRMIFLAHPATASRATRDLLREEFGFTQAMNGHHIELYDAVDPFTVAPVLSREERGEWFIFTTVRNHFDALASYVWKVASPKARARFRWTVEEFEQGLQAGESWIAPDRLWALHSDDADELLRFEHLQQDLSRILEKRVQLPVVGRTPCRKGGEHYRDFYTPETRALVEDRFGAEIAALGYAF